jgi:hypothetical protein
MARELDDAILNLRTNEQLGLWILRTAGDSAAVLATDGSFSGIRTIGSSGSAWHAAATGRLDVG